MTVTVEIRHEKAMRLLQDLADLHLIELLPSDSSVTSEFPKRKLSSFIGKINTGKTLEQLDQQLNDLRDDWNRTI